MSLLDFEYWAKHVAKVLVQDGEDGAARSARDLQRNLGFDEAKLLTAARRYYNVEQMSADEAYDRETFERDFLGSEDQAEPDAAS